VARRVRSLEASIGARLFDRLPDHFVLTAAGEELMADAQAMEQAAESIHRRSAGLVDEARGTVRLSAGEAMAGFLARHLPRLRRDLPNVEIELVESHLLANLSRREADLLIRDRVPDLASIITSNLGRTAYAIYRAKSLIVADGRRDALRHQPWIGFDEDHSYMPGQSFVLDLLDGLRPGVRVNNWLVLHEAVRSGIGLAVLPCYMGDSDPLLVRQGGVLAEVVAEQWLLVHRDLRALPRVRAFMDVLVSLFQEQRAVIGGRRATH
jgi:DNA-binding transcriptional LysR family regulator